MICMKALSNWEGNTQCRVSATFSNKIMRVIVIVFFTLKGLSLQPFSNFAEHCCPHNTPVAITPIGITVKDIGLGEG